MMRSFPDPITEGLSFWKSMFSLVDEPFLKYIYVSAGNPKLSIYTSSQLSKLIEDPASLNLKKGLDGTNFVKQEIRKALFDTSDSIVNLSIRSAIENHKQSIDSFMDYLDSIVPLFPRFLSNFFNGTWYGIVESTIRLFENSRTFFQVFGHRLSKKIDSKLKATELNLYISFEQTIKIPKIITVWECSYQHAKELRRQSWGRDVIGTIPHPMELLGMPMLWLGEYPGCSGGGESYIYMKIISQF